MNDTPKSKRVLKQTIREVQKRRDQAERTRVLFRQMAAKTNNPEKFLEFDGIMARIKRDIYDEVLSFLQEQSGKAE